MRRAIVVDSPPGMNKARTSASSSGVRTAMGEGTKVREYPQMFRDVPLEGEDADLHPVPPRRSSSMNSFALSNRTWWSRTRRSTTRSTSSGRAPALTARFRACSSI